MRKTLITCLLATGAALATSSAFAGNTPLRTALNNTQDRISDRVDRIKDRRDDRQDNLRDSLDNLRDVRLLQALKLDAVLNGDRKPLEGLGDGQLADRLDDISDNTRDAAERIRDNLARND